MTFFEVTAALNKMNQADPFVTKTGINGSIKAERAIDETYVHVSFSGNYTGGVRNIKVNSRGTVAILDGSFDPSDNVDVSVETLWLSCNNAIMSGVGDAELGYYIPSAGYFPVVEVQHKKGDWGDGDGPYDYVDFICTEEPLDITMSNNPYDYVDSIDTEEPLNIGSVEISKWESLVPQNLKESKKKVNEAVEEYIHPGLKIEAEYVPTVYYACYTLDDNGQEVDHFDDFDSFEDAIPACKQKTNDSHQATHVCVIIDDSDDEAYEFKRSYGVSNYEIVAEFSPDAGDMLIDCI